METCKECLHNGVCKLWRISEGLDAQTYTVGSAISHECREFQNKSRFVEFPCKIGQDVWHIRDYKGTKRPVKGEVSEMYFTSQMKLVIVVKYVGRGEYGKTVFRNEDEAWAALEKMKGEKENGY